MTESIVFISPNKKPLSNWLEAFPELSHLSLYGTQNQVLENQITFIDASGLDEDKSAVLIEHTAATAQKVLVLNSVPSVDGAVRAIGAGAVGYGHAYANPKQLKEMVLAVSHGGLWVGPALMKQVLSALARVTRYETPSHTALQLGGFGSQFSTLTEKELAVAEHVALGAANAEIAEKLGVSQRTVKSHLSFIFKKLNVRNRVELALLMAEGTKKKKGITNSNKQAVP